jgi:hypothetical protein
VFLPPSFSLRVVPFQVSSLSRRPWRTAIEGTETTTSTDGTPGKSRIEAIEAETGGTSDTPLILTPRLDLVLENDIRIVVEMTTLTTTGITETIAGTAGTTGTAEARPDNEKWIQDPKTDIIPNNNQQNSSPQASPSNNRWKKKKKRIAAIRAQTPTTPENQVVESFSAA